jgi:hypothetical protein
MRHCVVWWLGTSVLEELNGISSKSIKWFMNSNFSTEFEVVMVIHIEITVFWDDAMQFHR